MSKGILSGNVLETPRMARYPLATTLARIYPLIFLLLAIGTLFLNPKATILAMILCYLLSAHSKLRRVLQAVAITIFYAPFLPKEL